MKSQGASNSKRLYRSALCGMAMALPSIAGAQIPPAQPQTLNWLNEHVEVELRLKSASGSTVRLVVLKFRNLESQYLYTSVACWNKSSPCPQVAGATARVYLTMPWAPRLNVTKLVLCDAAECALPVISPAIQAKPGQSYYLRYDRANAVWQQPPSVTTP